MMDYYNSFYYSDDISNTIGIAIGEILAILLIIWFFWIKNIYDDWRYEKFKKNHPPRKSICKQICTGITPDCDE